MFCSRNLFNLTIVMALEAINVSNLGQIWFNYDYLTGKIFEHTFIGSSSFLLGCLLSGIFLSKMSASRIRSSAGRIRNLRCVFVTLSSFKLGGTLLLIIMHKMTIPQGYIEFFMFIV